jgi:predicted kinase
MDTNATRFVAVAGPPCSGKSTVARSLSAALSAPHLEMDRFRERVLPHSDQRVEDRDLAYKAMHFTAELMAPWCRTIVLDATYTAAVCRHWLVGLVNQIGGTLVVIECRVSTAAAVERWGRRAAHPALDLTAERVAMLARDYPYSPGTCCLDAESLDVDFVALAQRAAGEPLTAAACADWCHQGNPRQSCAAAVARVAQMVSESS